MAATQVTEKNLQSRNRNQQSEFRKQQLMLATLECIDKYGISQTTLANIARKAQVSQGNVVFHFQTKENLLDQALQLLSQEYMDGWQSALNDAGEDPVAQMYAMILAPFRPKVCNRRKIGVWYAFWGESRSRPKYMQVCGEQDRAYSDALLSICERLEAMGNTTLPAETVALTIESMIDGLWQNFLIGPAGFKRHQAIDALVESIKIIYPDLAENIGSMQLQDMN